MQNMLDAEGLDRLALAVIERAALDVKGTPTKDDGETIAPRVRSNAYYWMLSTGLAWCDVLGGDPRRLKNKINRWYHTTAKGG